MLIQGLNLSLSIDGRAVLKHENVECRPGEMSALIGPSGSGKTTLLHCLGLLSPVDHGEVIAGGRRVSGFSSGSRRTFWRDHAAFILQDHGIIDDESVEFNVAMKYRAGKASRDDRRIVDILSHTGLSARRDESASHLSGGEKQRLALARAIYKKADVLYADEPTASLDAENRRLVIQMLQDFAALGPTVIVATHDDEMIQACQSRHRVGSHDERHLP